MTLTSILNTANSAAFAQCLWGLHLMCVPGSTLDIVGSGTWDGRLQYSTELDVEQELTTEAQNPLDVKGGDKPREFEIRVIAETLATGQDPLGVYKSWMRDLGKANYFFLGAMPLDRSMYILRKVEYRMVNADIAADGTPRRAEITLTFAEDTVLKVANKDVKADDDKKSAKKVGKTKAGKAVDASAVWGSENVKTAVNATGR